MSTHKHISLFTAVLLNINIMIGTGIFINTAGLAQKVGFWGTSVYLLVGLAMFPLVITIAQLLRHFPGGGFYTFGASAIHPFVGFLSTWSYFFGKLGSATLGIHIFNSIVQPLIPGAHMLSLWWMDIFILSLCILLSTYNVQTGTTIQRYLILAKATPLIFVILSGIFWWQRLYLPSTPPELTLFTDAMPLVLFSLLGFEAVCALSSQIENPAKNGWRAVIISYLVVICLYVLYQLFFFSIVGPNLTGAQNYQQAFYMLFTTLFSTEWLQTTGRWLALLFVGSSALSGAYGILFANQWNLHSIAQKNLFLGSSILQRRNKRHMPYVCALLEGIVCIVYLYITSGQQFILQQLAAFGSTLTYTLSTLALLACASVPEKFLAFLSLCSCMLLLTTCIISFMHNGTATLQLFCAILCIGALLFHLQSAYFKRY